MGRGIGRHSVGVSSGGSPAGLAAGGKKASLIKASQGFKSVTEAKGHNFSSTKVSILNIHIFYAILIGNCGKGENLP